MGQTHLRALEGLSDVSVVVVAEPVETLRLQVEGTFGIKGFSSLDAMLSEGGIDGALIVTPSDSHVEVIKKVAAAGLPILCEKPCGVTPEDTKAARALVEEAGVALQIAYWRRFVPELQEIRRRIADGEFGEILSLSCLQWDGEPPAPSFRARSGGIFIDMGVHEFDQARWLTDSDFTNSLAMAAPSGAEVESGVDPDSAQVLASLASGAVALVSLGRYYAGGDMASIEIFGTRDHALCVFLNPQDGERAQLEALQRQASAFASFANGGPCEGATVNDAIAALEAASAATAQVGSKN
jgi:myo-inositol 2-dehydrogenase / D-chiro-inositol 1-dehydrogenase